MVSVQLSNSLSDFLAAAVKAETAPGLVAVAFNRDGSVAEAAQGTRDITTKEPMTLDTVVWMASMSKALTSLTALVLVEEHSFDLDSHDALVQLLPELALHNSRPISKIFDGKDEEGKWKLRDAEVGITLRHLLTHTSGLGYEFTSEEHKDLVRPGRRKTTKRSTVLNFLRRSTFRTEAFLRSCLDSRKRTTFLAPSKLGLAGSTVCVRNSPIKLFEIVLSDVLPQLPTGSRDSSSASTSRRFDERSKISSSLLSESLPTLSTPSARRR